MIEEKQPRRKGVVSIEAPPEASALALVLGETVEAFVAKAVAERVDALKARILPAVQAGQEAR